MTQPYHYGGSSTKRRLGKFILWTSRRLSKISYLLRLASYRLFKALSNKGNSLIEKSEYNTIDRLKIVFTSPRETRMDFCVNGTKMFLFDNYSKDEETTKRFIASEKGELDVEVRWEHYSYVKDNQNRWRL